MSASRSLSLAAAGMVVVLVMLAFVVLRSGQDESGPRDVVPGGGAALAPASHRIDTAHEPSPLGQDAAHAAGAAAPGAGGEAAPPVEATGLRASGRVVMEDGAERPDGLEVALRSGEPWPRFWSLSASERDLAHVPELETDEGTADEDADAAPAGPDGEPVPTGDAGDDPEATPGWDEGHFPTEAERFEGLRREARRAALTDDALAQATRVAIDEHGAFTLVDVPRQGAWVDAWSDELYLDEPVFARPGDEDLVIALTRGASLRVRVHDEADQPVEALVALQGQVDPMMVFRRGSRMLREAWRPVRGGTAQFEKVPAGVPLLLQVEAPGLAARSERLAPLRVGETREIALTLGSGASLAGRVVDDAGAPVAGARLRLNPAEISMGEMQSAERRSRRGRALADGTFVFTGLSAGGYELVATAPSREPKSSMHTLAAGEAVEGVELTLTRGAAVRGHVVDATGAPVAGARVMAYVPPKLLDVGSYFDRQYRMAVTSDADGRFEAYGFDEDVGVRVDVSADGYARARAETKPSHADVVVVLERASAISGIVVSKIDGEPVTEYVLQVTPAGGLFDVSDPMSFGEGLEGLAGPRRVTDPEGRFTRGGVEPGTYEVAVIAEGFGRATVPDVVVAPGQDARGLVVMLDRDASVSGRVVERGTGLPVPDADVSTSGGGILQTMTEAFTGATTSATSDDSGHFRLSGLGEGRLRLTVRHDRYLSQSLPEVWLMPGQQHEVGLVELGAGASVFGHVYDGDGAPKPGVEVLVSDATGTTMKSSRSDAEGWYHVRGLGGGTFQVTVLDFDMGFSARGEDLSGMFEDMIVEAIRLETDEQLELDLRAGGAGGATVYGTIRSAGGPEAGAMVSLVADGRGGMPRFATTDDLGRYEIERVAPGRQLMQVLPAQSEAFSSGSPVVSPIFELVDVVGEGRFQKDVLVPGGGIDGIAVDAEGGARVAKVRVVLERTDEGRPRSTTLEIMASRVAEAYSDAQGAFHFEHLPEGTYTLVAGGANLLGIGNTDWATTRVEGVAVTESRPRFTLRVELRRGGRVEGVVSARGGGAVAGAAVWAKDVEGRWTSRLSETASDEAGAYALPGLGEGRWTLAFRHADHALTVVDGVGVRSDEVTTRDVVLAQGPRVLVELAGLDLSTIDPQAVDILAVAPWGEVPLDLTTLQDVLQAAVGAGLAAGTIDLGRLPPGSYQISAWHSGASLGEASVEISAAPDPFVVSF